MSDFDSGDLARKVEERFNYEVPIHGGKVLLHPIILAVLDVLEEKGFLELEHPGNPHQHKWVDVTNEVVTSGEVCFGCGGIRDGSHA